MRSSRSTRSPRRKGPLRLLLVLAGEDHPRACTGRRLLRWHRAARVPRSETTGPAPVVLDPYAPTPLSSADRGAAESGGVLAVDCSWNRLSARGEFPGPAEDRATGPRPRAPHRRLPILVAANPQHYGRIAQLNTAEALGAALYVLGRPDEAASVLAGFAGGVEFLTINRDRLERYRAAGTPAEITAAERALFGSA